MLPTLLHTRAKNEGALRADAPFTEEKEQKLYVTRAAGTRLEGNLVLKYELSLP